MPIKIDDQNITARLKEIRISVGGKPGDFIPLINETINGKKDAEKIKLIIGRPHPSGLLIHNGQPVFVYIRDHIGFQFDPDPHGRNKIHFSFCQTLKNMQLKRKFEARYRVTNQVKDNKYYVDIRSIGHQSRESLETLYPCKHCLEETGYDCYDSSFAKIKRDQIVESFDANTAFDLLRQHFKTFHQQIGALRPDTAPAGYSPNQRIISERFRRGKNFTCEVCGAKDQQTHMHHKDGDKRNNQFDNLQCLCRPCHEKIHPHMRRIQPPKQDPEPDGNGQPDLFSLE